MCKIRAYRHSCQHTTLLHLSHCRGTYSCPGTTAPLCHAVPTLTVSLGDSCRDCQYRNFCRSWESRIEEARCRSTAARQILAEVDDDWGSCGEFCGGMDGVAADSASSGFGFGDADIAERARRRAEEDVGRLWNQYQCEQWNTWRFMVEGPDPAAVRAAKRKRRSSPRYSGASPLKTVMVSADMPAPQSLPEEDIAAQMERVMSDGPSDASSVESNSDSSSPGMSVFGGWGFSGGFTGGWEEEDSDSGVFSSSWAKDLEDAIPTDYDSMLPEYGIA